AIFQPGRSAHDIANSDVIWCHDHIQSAAAVSSTQAMPCNINPKKLRIASFMAASLRQMKRGPPHDETTWASMRSFLHQSRVREPMRCGLNDPLKKMRAIRDRAGTAALRWRATPDRWHRLRRS